MKKHKLPVLGIGLMLLLASCKKNDVQHQETSTDSAVTTPAQANTNEWKSISNWSSAKSEKFTTYSSTITDSSITNSVALRGLVLAFSKNGSSIKALPHQEAEGSDSYWYYEISEGELTLLIDDYKNAGASNASAFQYFVFSPQQLKDLEAKGYSKIELMQLAYEDVAAIVK